MIVIISIIVLISAYFMAAGLNRSSGQLSNAREERTMRALLQAKAALISYAASEQSARSMGQVSRQLGGLPCPDRDDDGDADCIGAGITNSVSLIGRLPWRTVGTEDLRDASGERLWYAVSRNFRKNSGVTVINSDTQGQISVTGTANGSNIVAVVIAPGAVIQGQNRVADHNSTTGYLEGFNANGNTNFIFTTNARPTDTLNDRLVMITQAELMAAVEPAVAARMERTVKPYLTDYFNQWQAFPFPAAFDTSLAQTQFLGDGAQTMGLLPITDFSSTPTPYPWAGVSVSKVSGTGRIDNSTCGFNATTASCNFRARDDSGSMVNLRFRVQAQVSSNVAISFARLPDIATVAKTMDGGNVTFLSPTIIGSVAAGGGGNTVSYEGTVPINCSSSCSNHNVVVTIPSVTVSRLTSAATVTITAASNTTPITITTGSAHGFISGDFVNVDGVSGNTAANGDWTVTVVDSTHFTLTGSAGSGSAPPGGTASHAAAWFIANEWYRQAYYAVSPGYLPGGAGSCNARPSPPAGALSPSCLMVTNLSPAYAVANDKRAVLILTGRSLRDPPRIATDVGYYLEGSNATLASIPYVFENRPGGPTSINDRVVVVSP
jgi:hypothetical protein